MSTSNAVPEAVQVSDSGAIRARKRRRAQTAVVGVAALLTAGSIVMAFVEKVQDAADRMH
jgi:hypothetical protein